MPYNNHDTATKSERITFRLSADQRDALIETAESYGYTMTEYIAYALEQVTTIPDLERFITESDNHSTALRKALADTQKALNAYESILKPLFDKTQNNGLFNPDGHRITINSPQELLKYLISQLQIKD